MTYLQKLELLLGGNYFDNKTDKQIIGMVRHGSDEEVLEASKMELERRMNLKLSKSITSLKEKVTLLNWVLAIATGVGAVATVFIAWKQFQS